MEQKGCLLIYDLWRRGNGSVHDMHVVKTDAKLYVKKTPERCCHEAEKSKKKKYLEAFLQKRLQVLTFVVSVDGILGVDAEANLKRIISRLETKWQQPYSRMCG